jgi:hypothetical protein
MEQGILSGKGIPTKMNLEDKYGIWQGCLSLPCYIKQSNIFPGHKFSQLAIAR